MSKKEAIIIKRTFSGCKSSPITSPYYPTQKWVLFLNSDYHKATGHADSKCFRTKGQAKEYLYKVKSIEY